MAQWPARGSVGGHVLVSDLHWASTYLKAVVTVRVGAGWVDAGAYAASQGEVLHVITAWNPGAARPPEPQNRPANRRLHAHLLALGLHPVAALGADPDSPHKEESWAVAGLSDEDARRIGAAFDQVAVFRVTATELAVLACREAWVVRRDLP